MYTTHMVSVIHMILRQPCKIDQDISFATQRKLTNRDHVTRLKFNKEIQQVKMKNQYSKGSEFGDRTLATTELP